MPANLPLPSKRSFNDSRVFWGSFIALVTCAFGFLVRTQVIDDWALQFGLSETEKGNILGVGFWPFAISIFLFSLVIDKVGYGRAAFIGFILHVSSATMLLTAKNYEMLYWGTFLFALSNGTIEAYINPVVASMYTREKTKWLNILHAGWPGGMVLAGLLAIAMGDIAWQWKIALIYLPTLVYAVVLIGTRFPVSERVAAGVPYREMLADFGALGMFVAIYLIALQVFGSILRGDAAIFESFQTYRFAWALLPAVLVAGGFGFYTRSFGRPIYFILLLIMLPLATTELGIDSWITELMRPEMVQAGFDAGWVLIYTATIMTVLRFLAGPIVQLMTPLALLAICSGLAILGLLSLSAASGLALIIAAATIYGVGKTFFWPTMLGVVAERFPKGGTLALNTVGGVGMLGLSVGMVFLGNIQDRQVANELLQYDQANQTVLSEAYLDEPQSSVLGTYRALDPGLVEAAPTQDLTVIDELRNAAKKNALATAAIFPAIMLLSYLGLILYFKGRGGYRAENLEDPTAPPTAHEPG